MLQIRLILTLAVLAGVLGMTVYVQSLRSQNARLQVEALSLTAARDALRKQVYTDAKARVADNARADAAEAKLKTFEENADREIASLRNPSRLCLDRDDTDRVRAIFRNPLR